MDLLVDLLVDFLVNFLVAVVCVVKHRRKNPLKNPPTIFANYILANSLFGPPLSLSSVLHARFSQRAPSSGGRAPLSLPLATPLVQPPPVGAGLETTSSGGRAYRPASTGGGGTISTAT